MPKRTFASASPSRALELAKAVLRCDSNEAADARFKTMLRVTLGLGDQTVKFCAVHEHELFVEIRLLLPDREPNYAHAGYVFGDRIAIGPMGPTHAATTSGAAGRDELTICKALRLQFLLKSLPSGEGVTLQPSDVTFEILRTLDRMEALTAWRPPCLVALGEYATPMPWCNPARRSVRARSA